MLTDAHENRRLQVGYTYMLGLVEPGWKKCGSMRYCLEERTTSNEDQMGQTQDV